MKFAIVDYVLRTPEASAFHTAAELGYDALELAEQVIGDANRLINDDSRRAELADLAKRTNVPIAAFFATHFLRENLLAPSETDRRLALAALRTLAEHVASTGADLLVVPLLGASDPARDPERVSLRAQLTKITGWGDLPEVSFALKSYLPVDEIIALLERAGGKRLGASLDPGTLAAMGRDSFAEIERLGHRLFHVHLKDRSSDGEPVSLGAGTLDVRGVIRALERIDFRGPITFEGPAGRSGIEAAKIARATLRRALVA